MMTLPTLYTLASSGAVQEWAIEVQGDQYRTHAGQQGGKITTTNWTTAVGTNIGRANARHGAAQAEFEAKAKWDKKYEKGAREVIEGLADVQFQSPMLAQTYEVGITKVKFPIMSESKIDGCRAVISRHGAFSRTGKPWVTIPHILEALRPIFDQYPDIVLDGELYNHELREDFNEICSVVKRTKPTAADIKKSAETVQFWWYDICDTLMKNSDRVDLRRQLFNTCIPTSKEIVLVATIYLHTPQEIQTRHRTYVDLGYEGQMLRLPDAVYEHKRSKSLLKHKEFQDLEYKIVEILEGLGNKSGMAGSMSLRHPDGRIFNSNITGSHEMMKELWATRHNLVGKWATTKFFNLTPGGIPRFPYVTQIRDAVGVD